MKKKLSTLFLIIGLIGFVGIIVLVLINVIDAEKLWVNYVELVCLLLFFISLNMKFKRYSDLDEAISCIRRTKRAISAIDENKGVSYVKQLSVQNQLKNSALLLDDIISKREFYTLKDNYAKLVKIKEHYKSTDGKKLHIDKPDMTSDIAVLEELLSELKEIN